MSEIETQILNNILWKNHNSLSEIQHVSKKNYLNETSLGPESQ